MKIQSKTIKRIPGYKFGYFPCETPNTMGVSKMQVFQTGVEADAIEALNFRLNVTKIVIHPTIEIPYIFEGKEHLYHPDIYFEDTERCNLLEIKASKYRHTAKNLAKFAAAIRWCSERRWIFHVWDEYEVANTYLIENLRFLRRYSKYKISKTEQWHLEEIIRLEKRPLTIIQLAEKRSENPLTIIPFIYCLLFRHLFYADLENEILSLNSLLYLPMMEGRPDYA